MDLPDAVDVVRQERRERPAQRVPGELPTIAVVAEGQDGELVGALSAAGWSVTGVLLPDVFDGLLWAAQTASVRRNYVEPAELVFDPTVDAACVAVGAASAGSLLPALLRAGLHVLLPTPVPLAAAATLAALQAADLGEAEHAVVFGARWSPAVTTLSRLLAGGAAGPVGQVTVRGWPAGPSSTADLVDLVTAWCGDVVSVCADAPALPATTLPGGATVRWALLTERGATVLVAHDGSPRPVVRLSCPQGRLELRGVGPGATLRWEDGAAGPPLPEDALAGAAGDAALVASARVLARAAREGDGVDAAVGTGSSPRVATLRDLFVASRVREALMHSATERRWVETG